MQLVFALAAAAAAALCLDQRASELLSVSVSVSVSRLQTMFACLPARCLFACAQTLRLTLNRTGSLVSTVRLLQARALGCTIAYNSNRASALQARALGCPIAY